MFGSRLLVALVLFLAASTFSVLQSFPGHAQVTAQEADTTPPVIEPLSDQIVAAVDGAGAVVTFPMPAVSDDTDPNPSLSCSPAPGSLFPLGATSVTCLAEDASGNHSEMSFVIVVTDQTAPVLPQPGNVELTAPDVQGAVVDFPLPTATDNVDGTVSTLCDLQPGALFPIGDTLVTCSASDAATNTASISFVISVLIPVPTATLPPTVEPSATPTESPKPPTEEPTSSETATAETATPTDTPKAESTGTATATPAVKTPTPAALVLTAPIPSFALVTNGGPLGLLASIWGDRPATISQEFGYTAFSVAHSKWYWYGRTYGLDGLQHPGIDISLPAGTPIYAPISGTVKVAGGQPYYTFYGNGLPGVGELLIETDRGDQVILGHLGLITVRVGDRIEIGQFVGLSGGYNGDHLHLETRVLQGKSRYLIVDPRKSFLVPALERAVADERAREKRLPGLSAPTSPGAGT